MKLTPCLAYSFTNNKFLTPEKIFLIFQDILKKENHRLAWNCISEDGRKKCQDFENFKEHSIKLIFDKGKTGLLEAKIVRCDVLENAAAIIIKNPNLARVDFFKEKGMWKIRDMVRVKEAK